MKANEEPSDNAVNLGRPEDQERMARIDEPIEDSQEANDRAQGGGRDHADDCVKSHCHIYRDIESDMAENRVEHSSKQNRDHGRS